MFAWLKRTVIMDNNGSNVRSMKQKNIFILDGFVLLEVNVGLASMHGPDAFIDQVRLQQYIESLPSA
ncbi:unnamed protein product [Dovyalis caffra]|uniref:Uncharacterized protein n=1 Tax=Dovyalis caffra TaxID=77055 RepID=A0AAV1QQR1_9ROSI|nr:unnamed protein product [Dovyalis caffra]